MRLPELTEVAPGVVVATGTHVNWILVIDGPDVTLVDAGFYRDYGMVRASLDDVRRRAPHLAAVVLTHAHVDHLGGAGRLHRAEGVPVLAHADEVAHVRGERIEQISTVQVLARAWHPRVLRWALDILRAGGPRADRVPDVQEFAPAGRPLDVPGGVVPIPTPGHTSGHCSYHLPEQGVLLVGDAFATAHKVTGKQHPHLLPGAFGNDAAAARASLDALEPLAADVVVAGHGPAFHGSPADAVRRVRESL